MTRHIYSVGQQVSFGGRVVTYLERTGVFTITKLLPPLGAELQYRIKSAGEAYERVASEHELQVAELEKPIVAAGWRLSSVDVDAGHTRELVRRTTGPAIRPRGRRRLQGEAGCGGLGHRIELLEHLPKNCWRSRSVLRQAQRGGRGGGSLWLSASSS
jgi:hypothetical protein